MDAGSQLPVPLLPAFPHWIDLYWRAWDLAQQASSQPAQAYDHIRALVQAGEQEAALSQAVAYLEALASAGNQAAPYPLVPQARLPRPAGRPWPEPAAILVEVILGIEADETAQRIAWRLQTAPPAGVSHLSLADNSVSLIAEDEVGGGIAVMVEAQHPFDLEIITEFTSFAEQIPPGRTRYLLTYLDRTDIRQE